MKETVVLKSYSIHAEHVNYTFSTLPTDTARSCDDVCYPCSAMTRRLAIQIIIMRYDVLNLAALKL